MSLAPPTTGKVRIKTSKGNIDFDLWCKEVPTATKSFLQKCAKGDYNGKQFDTIQPGYLVQTSKSKDVAYSLNDEFHSRVRWNQRGMLGAVFGDKKNKHLVDSFFVTLSPTPEFSNRAILLGKITDSDSWYNLLKIGESELEKNGNPRFPVTIELTQIVDGYFNSLPENIQEETEGPVSKKQKITKSTRPKVKISYQSEDENEDGDGNENGDKKETVKIQMRSANESIYGFLKANIQPTAKNDMEKYSAGQNSLELDSSSLVLNEEIVPKTIIQGSTAEGILAEPHQQMKEKKDSSKPEKIFRDPTIDSDYDSSLEFDDVTVDLDSLAKHRFTARSTHMIY